jgi:hypothetical protein
MEDNLRIAVFGYPQALRRWDNLVVKYMCDPTVEYANTLH